MRGFWYLQGKGPGTNPTHTCKEMMVGACVCSCAWAHIVLYTHSSWGGKQAIYIYTQYAKLYTHILICVLCVYLVSLKKLYSKKKNIAFYQICTHFTLAMSTMILWLNPGKNVKNAWPDARFSSKNTTVLMNCGTWRHLFNMRYIFVLARD